MLHNYFEEKSLAKLIRPLVCRPISPAEAAHCMKVSSGLHWIA